MHHLYTLPVESAPVFIPSTSFCSLSSWFTSSCTYHITSSQSPPWHLSLPRLFTPDLKLMSFTDPFLRSLLIPSGLPSRILNLYWTKWALAFVCFSFFLYTFFWLRVRLSWMITLSFWVHVKLCRRDAGSSRIIAFFRSEKTIIYALSDHIFSRFVVMLGQTNRQTERKEQLYV